MRIYLHSPVQLHHTDDDDDRSAITIWSYSKAKAIAHAISLLTLDQVH